MRSLKLPDLHVHFKTMSFVHKCMTLSFQNMLYILQVHSFVKSNSYTDSCCMIRTGFIFCFRWKYVVRTCKNQFLQSGLRCQKKKNSKAIRVLAKRLMNPSEIMHDTANKNGRHVGLLLPNK